MKNNYNENDYAWIKELIAYPESLKHKLDFFDTTADIDVPEDPIERVVFQEKAKNAIRKIAQNRGHILMVGKPGTGKSLLANMFKEVLDRSLGEYLRPRDAVVAFPGKDLNHIRVAYEKPEQIDAALNRLTEEIEVARENMDDFELTEQIESVRKMKMVFFWLTLASLGLGFFFPVAFVVTGLTGIGAIFMFMQENNHRVQEKVQRETLTGKKVMVKQMTDQMPEVLHDPRKERELMVSVSEPDSKNMKGGFRHDPYQSGQLQTPAHKRAYLGAHAKSPVVYIDELKMLVKVGYMSSLLEIMQNKTYILEGGRDTGSGAADRSENSLKADNIIIACCNHDTLKYLQEEGDGAFLSRIEDKGEIIEMESSVPENIETITQVAQFVKQEIDNLDREFKATWKEVLEKEGYKGIRKRSEVIFGKKLPEDYRLTAREFSRDAVAEIIKELRIRSSDRKLSGILRPINGIIRTAEMDAVFENATLVEPRHVRRALTEHISLEGAITREIVVHKKDLKKYISSMTDSIGYVVGLAVYTSGSSGQMFGLPLPIHCQVNTGGSDIVAASGRIGEIAKAAAQNVRASIKKVLKKIGAPYVGYEMHIEYIQAHDGVEGDSASVAMDIALISDFIQQPVNQRFAVTGSLTGDIILAVGGVTEKIRSIMDPDLAMDGVCVPWQNKHDIEPLLINMEYEYIQKEEIPGIRIFRGDEGRKPFEIYFCKTKYNAYRLMMGLGKADVDAKMAARSHRDLEFVRSLEGGAGGPAESVSPAAR